jgi:YHS domain-containing protein
MMAVAQELIVVDSRYQAEAQCVVCGNAVPAGEGVPAQYQGRTLRFKCPGCYARFEADPDRYLAGHEAECCKEAHEGSPASEWQCD